MSKDGFSALKRFSAAANSSAILPSTVSRARPPRSHHKILKATVRVVLYASVAILILRATIGLTSYGNTVAKTSKTDHENEEEKLVQDEKHISDDGIIESNDIHKEKSDEENHDESTTSEDGLSDRTSKHENINGVSNEYIDVNASQVGEDNIMDMSEKAKLKEDVNDVVSNLSKVIIKPNYEADKKNYVEEANLVVSEIRSGNEPFDDDGHDEEEKSQLDDMQKKNVSFTYTLGPKVTNWDEKRRKWLHENPRFPNYVNGRPRIMMVTGTPPGPCDNPIGDYYMLKSIKNKIDYSRIHGIELYHNMANLDKVMSGYWAKLPLLRSLMLSHPEIEWFWWMDSDAFFTDMVFEIPMSKYSDYNFVLDGYPDLVLKHKSWIGLNNGIFLLRNCQWSLDLIDAWSPMGPKGRIRDEAGKILSAYLKGRPAFEADDQSALIYLLITDQEKWMSKVYLENSFLLHGYWEGLVDKYEEMIQKYHPGLGDERWPFVTHFVGCKPCGLYANYPLERCLSSMERALNFADNQVLDLYGFSHRGLSSPNLRRIRNETISPLKFVDQFSIPITLKAKNEKSSLENQHGEVKSSEAMQSSQKRRHKGRRGKTKRKRRSGPDA